ncbi:MAG: methyltransferase domain-containing protein [Chitinophagales bacterium]|nr:methyltransferase domain-containing protein [Chitinophagales bacterium]
MDQKVDKHFSGKEYNAKEYWTERAKEAKDDLHAVCTRDVKGIRNQIMDRVQSRILSNFIKNESFAGKEILELGCGVGRWVPFFRQFGLKYSGVDISKEMLEIVKEKYPDIDFSEYNPGDRLKYDDNHFDYIVSITVLHHNPQEDQKKIIKELSRILKPGGKIFIMESCRSEYFTTFSNTEEEWEAMFAESGMRMNKKRLYRYFSVQGMLRSIKKIFKPEKVDRTKAGGIGGGAKDNEYSAARSYVLKLGLLDPYLMDFLPKRFYKGIIAEFEK